MCAGVEKMKEETRLNIPPVTASRKGSVKETFLTFIRLGCSSFGGPVAHLEVFRREFVERRRWLDEEAYADLVSLCQFLPGPASSQVGMALGLHRAGLPGALAAFLGFTLPSAALLFAFAIFVSRNPPDALLPWLQGLKVVAVAIVAHALVGMRRTLAPDTPRLVVAGCAALLSLSPVLFARMGDGLVHAPLSLTLFAPLGVGIVAGLFVLPAPREPQASLASRTGMGMAVAETSHLRRGAGLLVAFAAFLCATPLIARHLPSVEAHLLAGFAQAGTFVFGGGHVVLPFLQGLVVAPGWVSGDRFLAAYGAAQAVPGPLFTVATALGAFARGTASPLSGALVATVGIFTPAFLLVCGALPFWQRIRHTPSAQKILRGVNASVLGLLAATFVSPLVSSTLRSPLDVVFAVAGFGALVSGRVPTLAVVGLTALLRGLLP